MYDRSLLPPALFEFVVVSDTHFMLDAGAGRGEFASRQTQTARAGVALQLAASLGTPVSIHLGDLVQEYPETADYPRALDEALDQIEQSGLSPKIVAGNHDVGDKPDPIMPTRPVTAESLAVWHARVGPSWYAFEQDGCRFVVVNSQILNTDLPERETQRVWLEAELEAHVGQRLFVFLHLPLYLHDTGEPALGHYDNIAEPDRGWLVDLLKRYRVELVMAGHVHCSFFDRIARTRYLVSNSTSFTRPGFCHLFSSEQPPDSGRDDAPKLGFHLLRVMQDRTDVHFLRTSGATELEEGTARRVVSRTPRGLDASGLGITLLHSLSWTTDIPLAWPSAIRQRVRNDYPLLACTELGARYARMPVCDFDDEFQAKRLEILRDEGVRLVATCMWSADVDPTALLKRQRSKIDALELQLPGTSLPDERQIEQLKSLAEEVTPVSLSTVLPGETISGKQHPRTRFGFTLAELAALDQRLIENETRVARVLARVDHDVGPWEFVRELADGDKFEQIGVVDCSLELATLDEGMAANRVAETLFAMLLLPESRLFVEPLIDFDRTMDVCHGLLDPLCNPRPAFQVARCANTILTAAKERLGEGELFVASGIQHAGVMVRILSSPGQTLCLLVPEAGDSSPTEWPADLFESMSSGNARLYQLAEGLVVDLSDAPLTNLTGPTLISFGENS